MLERRLFGRAAGQGGPVGPRRVDRLKIVLGQQMERAKHLVVLQIERPCGLEVSLKGSDVRRLYDKLFWRANLAELLVLMRSRDPGRPP